MSQKVILITDPGIDGAFAVTLALYEPTLDVLGLLATAGNISAEQATKNIHVLIEQVDPPRWPRLGAAPPVTYDVDATKLHGTDGLGGMSFPSATLHHLPPSEKLLVQLVKEARNEVTVICLGPPTVLKLAFDLCAELPTMIQRLICLGGTFHEPGNAGPVSEFHFFCDPPSAHKALQCGCPITLIPLDVMRKVLFSPTDLLAMPDNTSKAWSFLRKIIPYGIAATCNMFGIEGFYLKDVLGIIAVVLPEALRTRPMRVDVETRGSLTRGMTVFDQRPWETGMPNVDLAIEVDGPIVRDYLAKMLKFESKKSSE